MGSSPDRVKPICCLFVKHAALRGKSNRLVHGSESRYCVRVGQHVYLWVIVSVNRENPNKRVSLVQSGPHHHLIENSFAEFALNRNHSLTQNVFKIFFILEWRLDGTF